MRIMKFGGKSLSSPEKTQNICKFIKKIYKNDKKIIIVVSAIGKTTDNLLELSKKYNNKNPSKKELAKLLSTGEIQSASLFAMMLDSFDVPAKSFSASELQITTFGDPLYSRIASINKSVLDNCINNHTVAVVAGFQGVNKDGDITLLGRGGSDTTAVAIGAVFDTEVEIFSDFDGVFAGDPREMDYKKIKKISYDQMTAMAENGAKVIDKRASMLAKKFKIDLISKSSAAPYHKGTTISNIEDNVVAISVIDHLTRVCITFSDDEKLKLITKIVLKHIIKSKFYNFSVNSNKIIFYIENDKKTEIISQIAKALKISG